MQIRIYQVEAAQYQCVQLKTEHRSKHYKDVLNIMGHGVTQKSRNSTASIIQHVLKMQTTTQGQSISVNFENF